MSQRINRAPVLFSIGVLQPTTTPECLNFLNKMLPNSGLIFELDEFEQILSEFVRSGHIVSFQWRLEKLYSLTEKGNTDLPKRLRHLRDKLRFYLIRDAHSDRFFMSRVTSYEGSVGVSPTALLMSDAERTVANKPEPERDEPPVGRGQVRSARPSRARAYWPRFARQFSTTGYPGAARDTLPPLFSLPVNDQVLDIYKGRISLNIDFTTIALCIGVSPLLLARMVRNPDKYYNKFSIKKSDGTERNIEAPRVFLKVVQWFILDTIIIYFPISKAVHSYLPNRSIVTNARIHQGRRFVAKIDIENFFGSINRKNMVKLFANQGYDANETNTILGLCMKDDRLPQGAPTSPALSNALLLEFDEIMISRCISASSYYSRYADDITISGDNRNEIFNLIYIVQDLLSVMYNLKLNEKKTKIIHQSAQQKVAGVVVNEKSSPPRKRVREIRAAFHNASIRPADYKERINELSGYIGYLKQFPKFRDTKILENYRNIYEMVRRIR